MLSVGFINYIQDFINSNIDDIDEVDINEDFLCYYCNDIFVPKMKNLKRIKINLCFDNVVIDKDNNEIEIIVNSNVKPKIRYV